jgi:hypothetical protein
LGVLVEFARPSQPSHIAGLAPIIHIGDLRLDDGAYQFAIVDTENATARLVVPVVVGDVRALMLSLPVAGVYRITYNASDGTAASFCHENTDHWTIGDSESFFDVGMPCVPVPPAQTDVTAIVVVSVVSAVVGMSGAVILIIALRIRNERIAKKERARQVAEDGLSMQSLAGTDITFYE